MCETCIAALQCAKSDTEKFASLLLVTKLVKSQDCDGESRRKIFDAIGFSFVNRLLNTNEVPDGCPIYIYKAIGLTLLSCFCMEPDLISQNEMRSKVSDLTQLILTCGESSDEQVMINDAMICLSSVVKMHVNDVTICKEIIPNLVEIVVNEMYGYEKCIDLITYLIQNMGSAVWDECADSFDVLMNVFSGKFVNDNGEVKFNMCKKMAVFVLSCPERNVNDKMWSREIRQGLSDILFSKVSLPQMDPALMLISVMIEKFGVHWAFSENSKFFLIFSHLTCIEVRMIVEDRCLEQVIEERSLLVSCFISLENILTFLVNNDHEIDFNQRQQLYSALNSAMNGVLHFLTTESREIESLDNLSTMKKQVIFSCVRLIGVWLAEEISALRDDVYAILPFLLKVAVHASKMTTTSHDNCVENDGLDILRFLLPGMCHLTAEDEPRSLLIALKFHETLYYYMLNTWKLFTFSKGGGNDKINRRKDSLITTCGIFMNIIVLDASLVASDKMFHKLLRFVFNALPELENKAQHLILIGNLSVIGLLLLRHYANKVKSCESSIYMYLSSSIKFLWDAHNIEDSRDYNSIVIAQEYRRVWNQIMELWFLGMQALATLLKELPWIGQFILESGWISVILQTLRKIEAGAIDASTKSAYEHFLCCLVPTEKCIQQIFVKEGGIEVCTTHAMKELEYLLRK
uniref:Neurochondrin n=1 Tax=Strigamia maritima TaxID=126957 RepID=T1IIF8_STRMM